MYTELQPGLVLGARTSELSEGRYVQAQKGVGTQLALTFDMSQTPNYPLCC